MLQVSRLTCWRPVLVTVIRLSVRDEEQAEIVNPQIEVRGVLTFEPVRYQVVVSITRLLRIVQPQVEVLAVNAASSLPSRRMERVRWLATNLRHGAVTQFHKDSVTNSVNRWALKRYCVVMDLHIKTRGIPHDSMSILSLSSKLPRTIIHLIAWSDAAAALPVLEGLLAS